MTRRLVRRSLIAPLVVVPAAACLFAFVLPLPGPRLGHGCSDLPVGAWVRNPDSTGLGTVQSCRDLDSRTYLFGARDPSAVVLVRTTQGLLALRITYHDLSAGRQYRSEATELDADQAPGLTTAERTQLRADIAARGGLSGTWILHYGDG